MLKDSDDLSWYSRKADGLRRDIGVRGAATDRERARRVKALLDALVRAGVKGSIEHRTLYTRRLPPGCRGCLGGKGSTCFITGKCTRECFFCFNEKPRRDGMVMHGIPVDSPDEALEIVDRYALRTVGISGGEPLLFPDRVLGMLRAFKRHSAGLRVDLYTNGDRLTPPLARELREAGLDSVRFNLAAREFDTAPVRLALEHFDEVTVELPVVPERMMELEAMVLELDALGVPFLNIHELFACRENERGVVARGHAAEGKEAGTLQWKPVAEAEEAALSLLLFGLKNTKKLSIYYCSCGTQELIGSRGLRRRRRVRGKEVPRL